MLAKNEVADRASTMVRDTIADLLEEQGLDNPGIEDDAKLVDTLGLKSMDIAQIVLVLEDELDVDPFQETPITSIRTVGDLIGAYQLALDPESVASSEASNPSSIDPAATTAATAAAAAPRRANRRR